MGGLGFRVGLLLLVVVGVAVVWLKVRDPAAPVVPTEPEPVLRDRPAMPVSEKFRNTDRAVKYVGDSACAGCHPVIDQTYHHHPMGRSAAYTREREAIEIFTPKANTPLQIQNYELLAEPLGQSIRHRVRVAGIDESYNTTAEIVIGSGTRGRSYLSVEEGSVWQTPISWFGQTRKQWDLSPGFDLGNGARRPITAECLFCHVNHVETVPGAINHYLMPLLGTQAAIGCERCHGPGELHVRERGTDAPMIAGQPDSSIVNPKHLSQELRLSICQQCHLQGEATVLRSGFELTDFRPGLPWGAFAAVFVRAPHVADAQRSVGQFEQMIQSRCYTQSGTAMDCTSCHDPHSVASPEKRADAYDAKCLACHADRGCTAPQAARTAANNRCIGCHMPRADSSNIAHTSVVDHRVPRFRDAPMKPGGRPTQEPIVRFEPTGFTPSADEQARDLGIALARLGDKLPSNQRAARQSIAVLAERKIGQALGKWPNEPDIHFALSQTRAIQGNFRRAISDVQESLKTEPNSERYLEQLVELMSNGPTPSEALPVLAQLLADQPRHTKYWLLQASVQLGIGQTIAAEQSARAALKIQPLFPQARLLLAVSLAKQGQANAANVELETAVKLATTDAQRESLRRQFTAWGSPR